MLFLLTDTGEREQNVSILEELAAIRCALETSPDDSELPGDEFIIGLLAELQDEQDREMARAIVNLTELVCINRVMSCVVIESNYGNESSLEINVKYIKNSNYN